MRKIVDPRQDHNIVRALASAALATLLLGGAIGCQSDPGQDTQQSAGATGRDCAVTINTAPWQTFTDVAQRLKQGEPVSQAELEAYAQMPSVATWRRSLAPQVPQVSLVANWLRIAMDSNPPRSKLRGDNRNIRDNFIYSYGHRAEIDSLLQVYSRGSGSCELLDLISFWFRPEDIPTPLVVNFLPSLPEIRFFEGQVCVDTGALMAGGSTQANRTIASLMYGELEARTGPNPLTLQGAPCIAECLRVMLNEGVKGWIMQTTSTSFASDHPTLKRVNVVPETFYRTTQRSIDYLNTVLPSMFADPAAMDENGLDVARYLAASNALTLTGVAMAELIVGRFGEDRLREVRNSVPDFLAAYQAAAVKNAMPVPEPGTVGIELYESVPPLAPAVYDQLQALLKNYFREQDG